MEDGPNAVLDRKGSPVNKNESTCVCRYVWGGGPVAGVGFTREGRRDGAGVGTEAHGREV